MFEINRIMGTTEYIGGMPQSNGRSYEEIMEASGSYYDPGAGTNTMAALRALYGMTM
ncbi:hypothetical protein [Dyadobacter sp.]|uniref:hypothetical protein n=1 Tax=Dyadobacter sp. TaxID=1914288 RepID=UPI003F72933A